MKRTDTPADVAYVGFLLGHGGDAVQMLSLARGVRDRGASVRLLVPALDESVTFKRQCDDLGLDCERTELIRVGLDGTRQSFPSIVKLLRSVPEPIVHFHTGNSCLPRMVLLAMSLLRFQRSFVTVQSPYETIAADSKRAKEWAFGAKHNFYSVVSPSDHSSSFQLRCGIPPALVDTVRNAVDVEAMASGDPSGPRQVLGVGPDVPVILFCSRIDGQKRPLDAVRAFAKVASDHPDAIFAVVGTGTLEADMAAEAARLGVADRVKFVGYQTNVPDWLAAATVWVLPTERENFSVAVLEAMAAGCAVVSTVCPGNDEVLIDGTNSLTAAVGDVDGAAAAINRLLDDPELRARLGDQARVTSAEHSVDRMVDNYIELYQRAFPRPTWL